MRKSSVNEMNKFHLPLISSSHYQAIRKQIYFSEVLRSPSTNFSLSLAANTSIKIFLLPITIKNLYHRRQSLSRLGLILYISYSTKYVIQTYTTCFVFHLVKTFPP